MSDIVSVEVCSQTQETGEMITMFAGKKNSSNPVRDGGTVPARQARKIANDSKHMAKLQEQARKGKK